MSQLIKLDVSESFYPQYNKRGAFIWTVLMNTGNTTQSHFCSEQKNRTFPTFTFRSFSSSQLVSHYEEIKTQNMSLNMPQNVNVKKKHNGISYSSRLCILCCHICSIGLVCNTHGSRCCFLCFCKRTNTLCFGQHHTKVICNILHCMMGFFQITMLSIL